MMLNDNPTIYVVDDDPLILETISDLIHSVSLKANVFNSAQAFLEHYDPDEPGCLILDVRMQEMSGLQLQQELNESGVTLPIIFISGHADVQMAAEAFRRGAFDFIEKPFRDQELLDSIQNALKKDYQNRQINEKRKRLQTRLSLLSEREREILEKILEGMTSKAIAYELNISPKTVDFHRGNIMQKMQAETLVALTKIGLETGLIS